MKTIHFYLCQFILYYWERIPGLVINFLTVLEVGKAKIKVLAPEEDSLLCIKMHNRERERGREEEEGRLL